jgi:hypothetical protein
MHVDIYVKDILKPQLLLASFASKNSMPHPVCVAAAAQLPVYLLGEPVSLLASTSPTHHHQSIPLEASRQLHGTPGPVQVLSSRVSRHAEYSAYMYWPVAHRVLWPKAGSDQPPRPHVFTGCPISHHQMPASQGRFKVHFHDALVLSSQPEPQESSGGQPQPV